MQILVSMNHLFNKNVNYTKEIGIKYLELSLQDSFPFKIKQPKHNINGSDLYNEGVGLLSLL